VDRVVLDTNQIVSGLLMRRGAQAELLEAWRERRFLLITSPFILNEVEEVLSQPLLRQKYHLQGDQIERFLNLLRMDSLPVPGIVRPRVCRDPEDDAILGCAVEGEADYLVTGDKDLLVLKEYRGIRIQTARHYMERLRLER
jgi:putative PIN family toxin of toxin-antitoxin system